MAREGRDLILQMGKGGERGVEWPRRGVLRQWEGGSLIHPTLARSPISLLPIKASALPDSSRTAAPPLLPARERARLQQSPAPEPQSGRNTERHSQQPWQPPPWPPPGARPPPPWPRPPSSTSPCATAPRRWRPSSACAPRPPASAAASRTASRASWTLERPPPSCSPPPPSSPMYDDSPYPLLFTLNLVFSFPPSRIWMG